VLNKKVINNTLFQLQNLIQQGIPLFFLSFSLVAFQSVFQVLLKECDAENWAFLENLSSF